MDEASAIARNIGQNSDVTTRRMDVASVSVRSISAHTVYVTTCEMDVASVSARLDETNGEIE